MIATLVDALAQVNDPAHRDPIPGGQSTNKSLRSIALPQ
jgi:hypothetical protein